MISRPASWRLTLTACLILTVLLVLLFWPTLHTMVTIWFEVETYSHGFLILPISLWLAWRRRDELFRDPPELAPWALVLCLGAAAGWTLAVLLGIQVIEQLSLIAIWVAGLWALIGQRAARVVAFPLLFLFLMVPMGDSLVPPMMDFTADFTVKMLELTGIPVYREGLYFVIPSGSWSVVEACSGVRYLIASITLGLLYAYLSYRSLWRRALFVLLAALVPVLANGIRAYMIVMIGHLSDMKLAVGVDHLIYGWLFFGLVMLLLFWLGNLWVEPADGSERAPKPMLPRGQGAAPSSLVIVLVTALGVAVGARAAAIELGTASADMTQVQLPAEANGWRLTPSTVLEWPLRLQHPDELIHVDYVKGDDRVSLVLGVFHQQRQGGEVVSSENQVLDRNADPTWRVLGHGRLSLPMDGDSLAAPVYRLARTRETLLGESEQRLLSSYWYRLGDRNTASELVGKWYQALALLTDARSDGAFVIIATADEKAAPARLQAFSSEVLPAVWAVLDRSASQ